MASTLARLRLRRPFSAWATSASEQPAAAASSCCVSPRSRRQAATADGMTVASPRRAMPAFLLTYDSQRKHFLSSVRIWQTLSYSYQA